MGVGEFVLRRDTEYIDRQRTDRSEVTERLISIYIYLLIVIARHKKCTSQTVS